MIMFYRYESSFCFLHAYRVKKNITTEFNKQIILQ